MDIKTGLPKAHIWKENVLLPENNKSVTLHNLSSSMSGQVLEEEWKGERNIRRKKGTKWRPTVASFLVAAAYLLWAQSLSSVWLFVTLWTLACQAPLSTGFPRQEHWSGLPFPSPGGLCNTGIKPICLVSPVLVDGFFIALPPRKPHASNFLLPIRAQEGKCWGKLLSSIPRKAAAAGGSLWAGSQPTADSPCSQLLLREQQRKRVSTQAAFSADLELRGMVGVAQFWKPSSKVKFWMGTSAPQKQGSCGELQLDLWRDEGGGRGSVCVYQKPGEGRGSGGHTGAVPAVRGAHGAGKRPHRSRSTRALCAPESTAPGRGQVPGWREPELSPAVKALPCPKYSSWNRVLPCNLTSNFSFFKIEMISNCI